MKSEEKSIKINYTLIIFKLSIGLIPLLFMTSCKPITSTWVINNLFPNLWVFLANLMGAIILIVAITCLLWKPIKKSLQKRHDYIDKQIKDAEKNKQETTIELQKANQLKIAAMSDAMNITDNANSKANSIIAKAKNEAKEINDLAWQKAKNDIDNLKKSINKDAKKNIVDLAINVASSILEKNIDKHDNDKYIEQLLESIEKDHNNKNNE